MTTNSHAEIKQTQQQFSVGKERIPLSVTTIYEREGISILFSMPQTKKCVLHWGLVRNPGEEWTAPPKSAWSDGSEKFDELAVRSPFVIENNVSVLSFKLSQPLHWKSLGFVLYFPDEERFEKNGRYDYSLSLIYSERSTVSPDVALKEWVGADASSEKYMFKNFQLDSGDDLALCRKEVEGGFELFMVCNVADPLLLHWGITDKFNSGWSCPSVALRNAITVVYDDRSARNVFTKEDGLCKLQLSIPGSISKGPEAINFLLYQTDEDRWIKYKGNDIFLPLFVDTVGPAFAPDEYCEMIESIVGSEAGKNSWTLMHRYNLCMDLISRNSISDYSLMIIFVWLRYSATRQLDWQRNYNTKPRELSHSQQQLTYVLARIWRENPGNRYWVRKIMHTVGRGGDGGQGQRIRDEILNIMHRNHIKETHGHFLEEWHQKLHNNTTPDDVEICKAYIAYLQSNGDLNTFYETLSAGGVSRDRMRSYDRAIISDPDFRGEVKGALIHDFTNYLEILQTVHGGAELSTAINRAQGRLDDELRESIYGCVNNNHKRIERVLIAREKLAGYIENASDDTAILDLLYLDLALEDVVRRDFESIKQDDYFWLVAVLPDAIKQFEFGSSACEELMFAQSHWQRLVANGVELSGLSALEGVGVAERLARVVQDNASHISEVIQPIASYIGGACRCDEWAVKLFAEETVRGGASFPLSKVVHVMLKYLRTAAGMGGWQVIGPGEVCGKLVVVSNLHEVQEAVYTEPTVLMTEIAGGDEEVPEGAVGLLTRVAPDLVSHLSVRARNLGVVFGACFEDSIWNDLQGFVGKDILLSSTQTGGIDFKEGVLDSTDDNKKHFDVSSVRIRAFSSWAVGRDDFTRDILGGKSNNLNLLLGKLPEWMKLPMSMAVPFGGFEKVLNAKENAEFVTQYNSLVALAEDSAESNLQKLRDLILTFNAPADLKSSFMQVWDRCDFAEISWNEIWLTLKKVWASKWNNRAFFSRKHLGLAHEKLQMAVLVQQVVSADYAFVIHTVNPLTGDQDEILAEVVLGLGETLVGNYPGRSLGFTYNKKSKNIEIFSLTGKSEALYGGGVIFRSDSNGEDLEGFAGAGLYDSFLAVDPESRVIDYTDERLLVDIAFREELCRKIGEIGVSVESICGSAQDIEGARQGDDFYIVQNRPQVGL